MSTDEQIEQEIQAKGLNAPRVTPGDIEGAIISEHYFNLGDGVYGAARKAGDDSVQAFPASYDLTTICVLGLANGFTVIGESACVSAENFNAEIGKKIARQNAVGKVWPLMGFALADRIYLDKQDTANFEAVTQKAYTGDGGAMLGEQVDDSTPRT